MQWISMGVFPQVHMEINDSMSWCKKIILEKNPISCKGHCIVPQGICVTRVMLSPVNIAGMNHKITACHRDARTLRWALGPHQPTLFTCVEKLGYETLESWDVNYEKCCQAERLRSMGNLGDSLSSVTKTHLSISLGSSARCCVLHIIGCWKILTLNLGILFFSCLFLHLLSDQNVLRFANKMWPPND